MNINHMVDAPSYTLVPGYELRPATVSEIRIIKMIIAELPADNFLVNDGLFWECRWPHFGGTIERVSQDQWRYFVIAFNGTEKSAETVEDIQSAFDLSPIELERGFTGSYGLPTQPPGTYGAASRPVMFFHILREAQSQRNSFFKDISRNDLEITKKIYLEIQQNNNTPSDVRKILSQLRELKGLPHESPLRFLGYFAILESLLTHDPKPGDPYDSITRQVQKKVALLDHRFERHIDYTPFGDTSSEKIWSRMYGYRSCLAHGGTPDFGRDLKVLIDHEHALNLLKETVKSTVVQALAEPQLLFDLREC